MNRLSETRTNMEIKQWKYIPGDLNPANICASYYSFQYLNSDSIWIRDPNFLYQNEKENDFQYVIKNNETENFNVNIATNSTTKLSNSTKFISSVKRNHYSSCDKSSKYIAWILKSRQNYISYKWNKEHKSLPFTNLNIQDTDCAENETLKHCQLVCFENEFVDLVKGFPLKGGKLIHLVASFILALHRFKARRKHPKSIWSDSGSNFIGAERELKDALSKLDQKKIINEFYKNRIQWMFNPPKSPWMVVAMGALINITKSYLKAVVKDRLLHEDALHMLLLETESIVNSRPLTSVSDNIDDLESLRPNHFLIGRSSPNTNFANITEKKH